MPDKPNVPISYTQPVKDCPRCGADHDAVEFQPLTKPTIYKDVNIHMTHWAPCPTNQEPIIAAPEVGKGFEVRP